MRVELVRKIDRMAAYATDLHRIRDEYRTAIERLAWRGPRAKEALAHPDKLLRALAWREVSRDFIGWSIVTDLTRNGRTEDEELDLWRRVERRASVLSDAAHKERCAREAVSA